MEKTEYHSLLILANLILYKGCEIPPNSKVEKTPKKLFALIRLAHKFAGVDYVGVESSCFCFPREFCSPGKLVSFDPTNVTYYQLCNYDSYEMLP